MEAQVEYKVESEVTDHDVDCVECGFNLGEYVQVGDDVWLSVGNLMLKVAHGKCVICGTEWHFVSSDKKLERLIERMRINRKLTDSK